MRVFVLDRQSESRAQLSERVNEALRQAGIKRADLVEGDPGPLFLAAAGAAPDIAFLGPGCYVEIEEAVLQLRSLYPAAAIAVVLSNDLYAAEAVGLRRVINARVMPIADIAQMAQFVLDSVQTTTAPTSSRQGIIPVVQFKGGVGATTVAAALASCWAQHEQRVALVDLDDLNPQITEWAGAGSAQRAACAALLRAGTVPKYRLKEIVTPVHGYDDSFVVVGQPHLYRDAFHFKADVLPDAPSAADFITSLLNILQDEYDVVVVDTGRSWGISTFAALPMSRRVLLVTDDDGLSLRRTIDSFIRVYKESDDAAEFDLSRWSVIFNAYTGRLLAPQDAGREIAELDLFPEAVDLFTIPFCERGRLWGAPGESFYDLAAEEVKAAIREIAFSLFPFRYEETVSLSGRFRRGLGRIFGEP